MKCIIPDKFVCVSPYEDISWPLEFENVMDSIGKGKPLDGNINDLTIDMHVVDPVSSWSKNSLKNGGNE